MTNKLENSIKQSLEGLELPYNADAWAKLSNTLDAQPAGINGNDMAAGTAGAAAAIGVTEAVKSGLESIEMPYEPAAWTKLQSQLDKKLPVTGKGSGTKWFVAATAVIGIATASYFIFNNEGQETTNATAQTETTSNEESLPVIIEETSSENTTHVNPIGENELVSITPSDESNPSDETLITLAPTIVPPLEPVNATSTSPSNGANEITPHVVQPEQPASTEHISIPTIANMCQGETFTVENTNSTPLLLMGPELYFIIPSNETRTIRTKKSGIHSLGLLDNQMNDTKSEFMVKEAPVADFTIDATTKFENGLPTTKVMSTVTGTNFEWIYNNQRVSGSEADAHFYGKGNNNISLIVTGSNGCQSTITKTVYVEENYNLQAMNAFRPNSTDPATRTFMPYALLERDVPFTMIIIDPRYGRVIYETKDASQGWDGTDSKTGRPVTFETSYIWKVTLENKELEELKNEYSGHVIPVHSSN